MTPLLRAVRSRGRGQGWLLAVSALLALAFGTAAVSAVGSVRAVGAPHLEADGIGTVQFGLPKARAVSELSNLFGPPSARFVNSGCSPRCAEVAWGELYAEFRLGKLSGYRYLRNGWPPKTYAHRPPPPKVVSPKIATSKGITLGSTLAQVKAAYRPLQRAGADWWKAPNQLVFVDDAQRDPIPPTSRIIEIKTGTCGSF
jgi:hypothetical protein